MNEDGMLVSREWLERVDAALFGTSRADADGKRVASLFYDVRPARLESAWTQNGAGLWTATASFLVNDAADSSFVFPVYAPTATEDPGGEVQTTRFFVVWRGRWELVAGAGVSTEDIIDAITGDDILDKLTITSATTVTDVSQTTTTLNVPTAATVTFTPAVSCALVANDTQTTGSVKFVTDIQAVGGVLGVETKFLTATLTASQQTETATLTTSSNTVVTNVSKTTANRVASIEARS